MEKVKIYLQKKYFDILDFNYFTNKLFGTTEYELFEKETKNGQYMKLEYNGHIIYVLLSRKDLASRNAYIAQSISTSLAYIEKEIGTEYFKVDIFYYLIDVSKYAKTDFHIFTYRGLETLGIKMLNNEQFIDRIFPFTNFSDMLNSKNLMKKNQNNPSSFEELNENINFFLKTFGANGKEATFNCLVISKITNKPIIIFQVEDNESISVSKTDKKLLEDHKIFIDQDNFIKEYINKGLISNEKITSFRKQGRFKANLIKKFGEKKCYLCGCDIENIIIASHIHRVTDIENDSTLNTEDKIKQIIDGDNGFWLCANHDKMFEYGIIYFNNNKLIINGKLLEELQENFIKNITINFEINDVHYNDNISNYLKKHKNRVLI
ncbi:hypothetical protein BLM37_00040 [Candidatus Gracilibacteria bacterium GN02-873]|nr:hypothetical protein BLM37_00040 [Candidatus Gracilibacteria bacterium GN02-873]